MKYLVLMIVLRDVWQISKKTGRTPWIWAFSTTAACALLQQVILLLVRNFLALAPHLQDVLCTLGSLFCFWIFRFWLKKSSQVHKLEEEIEQIGK